SSPKLTDFKVLVFDTYGTLADWETGIHNAIKPLLSKYPASASWTRDDALKAFTAIELDLQAREPDLLYADVLAKAHEIIEERLRAASGKEETPASTDDQEHIAFGQSVKDWPVFPDSPGAL
ncbi:hypothetical protein K435DRAFT_558040, partial [Dendrothele bispora CBS 962.96]